MTVSQFTNSPGCKEEEFSHTVTANSNPLRQKEKEPFEVPDISVFWNLFRGCFPSPQSFLRIAPFIWITPVARFVLHPLASQKSGSGTKSSKESWITAGEKNRSTERSSRRRLSSFSPAPVWGPLFFLPLACRAWPPSKEFSLYSFCLSLSVLL